MIEPELKKQVVDKVVQCKGLAYAKLNLILPPIELRFDLVGVTAAKAYAKRQPLIRLNEYYLNTFTDTFLNQTIPHEVAHIVADFHYSRYCKHGWRWKLVMKEVYGLEPKVYHTYGDSPTHRKQSRYDVLCECNRRLRISVRHYNLLMRRENIIIHCKWCNAKLPKNEALYTKIF